MSHGLCEQADGHGKGRTYRKKHKNRNERRASKASLKKGDQPTSNYGKYKGYQT